MRRKFARLVAIALLSATARVAHAVEGPADVVVYANKVPAYKLGGGAFENPFDEDTTRIVVEPITNQTTLRHPKGTTAWMTAAWAKYVFMSNYDEGLGGFGGLIEDQRIGVFDTERRTFCELDIEPGFSGPQANASVYWIGVAEPTQRKTRLYFIGYVSTAPVPDPPHLPPAFGYIEADLDRDPCQPYDAGSATAGWRVVGFTAKHLNDKAKAALLPTPCDNTCLFGCRNWCAWDGMAVLDRNTVVAGEWFRSSIAAIRVADDPGGANPLDILSVADVYQMPFWQPDGPGGECFLLRPVNRPAVDPTRTDPSDFRFSWGFDRSCIPSFPGCSTSCVGGININPIQEFRFDAVASSITPTSPIFQAATDAYMRSTGLYDSLGHLWLSENSQVDAAGGPGPVGVQMVIYKKQMDGEHAYYDEGNPGGSVVVPPDNPATDVLLYYDGGGPEQHRVLSAVESGAAYFKGLANVVRRAHLIDGEWLLESASSYQRHVGQSVLPHEPTNCVGSSPGDGPRLGFHLSVGGSPRSLWYTPEHFDPERRNCDKNSYLIRIPLATAIPEGSGVAGRPGLAWDSIGERLWMTRQQNGLMQFRVREDGFWSSWATMPTVGLPAGVTMAADGAILTNGIALLGGPIVEVIARGTDGRIYNARLTSSLTCAVASCQWGSWTQLPALPFGNVATNDVAAVYQNDQQATVAVRSNAGHIWVAVRSGISTSWFSWKKLALLTTTSSPSMAWNPTDGHAWVVANDAGQTTNAPKYRRISGDAPTGGWTDVQTSLPAGVTSWGTPPAITFDGTRMRVFIGSGQYPPGTFQTIRGSSTWSVWRRTSTKDYALRQPAVTSVSGDVNLVTIPYSGIMNEQAME